MVVQYFRSKYGSWGSIFQVQGILRFDASYVYVSRKKPYSEDEIKIAFRTKAMECHQIKTNITK
ncbi:hypothetical protein HPP92_028673, partial [Vanilla planifolia]